MADHGTAGVLTAVVTMTVKPDREEDYLAFVTGVMETVHREEPDVLLYVMHRHPQLPHTFVWVERYASRAALEAVQMVCRYGRGIPGASAVPDRTARNPRARGVVLPARPLGITRQAPSPCRLVLSAPSGTGDGRLAREVSGPTSRGLLMR